jgi:hypothetical protein
MDREGTIPVNAILCAISIITFFQFCAAPQSCSRRLLRTARAICNAPVMRLSSAALDVRPLNAYKSSRDGGDILAEQTDPPEIIQGAAFERNFGENY